MRKEVVVLALVLLFVSFAQAQLADTPWPTFHGDAQRRGLSPYNTSHIDGTIKWVYEAGISIESSAAIGADGTVYAGIDDGYFYAFNGSNGKVLWKTKIGTPLYKEYGGHVSYTSTLTSPALAKDGTIYTASRDQYLLALGSDGAIKWKFPLNLTFDHWGSPVIADDGTIYMTSSKPKAGLFAIHPNGTKKWFFGVETNMFNSPAVGKDGTIYAALPTTTKINSLYAFHPDGKVKWKVDTDLFLESTPAIAPDGTIYVGSFAKDSPKKAGVYAFSPGGRIQWYFETESSGEVMSTPAIGKDGIIYFGADDKKFYALYPNGTEKWQLAVGGLIEASPAIGADGTIYIGASMVAEGNPSFYALNPNCTVKWHNFKASNSIIASAAIGKDGTVYVGSFGGVFYAFGKGGKIEEKKLSSLQKKTRWRPQNGTDCLHPKTQEISRQCDIYCSDFPERCPDYWKMKRYDRRHVAPPIKQGKDLNFLEKLFYWIRDLFG